MAKLSESRNSTRIFIGLIVGLLLGLFLNYLGDSPFRKGLIDNVLQPFGNVFLRSLFMVVVPLVFASLITGVGRLGTVNRLGKMGSNLAVYYIVTSLIAVVIGQILVTVIQPGAGLPQDLVERVMAESSASVSGLMEKSTQVNSSLWPGLLSTIIPKNIIQAMASANMLAIIFSAIMFGCALLAMNKDKAKPALDVAESVTEATILIVGWIMKVAPFAVASLMMVAVARFGIDILSNLAKYVLLVLACYLIHFLFTYQLFVRYVLKYPFGLFMRKVAPVMITAFSTSSSSATMPTTIRTAEKSFGVKNEVAAFSIPLGTTVNMDGTALFECVAALFIAQVFGVDISLGGQVALTLLIVVSSIGVAGVPGGSIPILMSAMAMLNIPPEGIALILGVDRLLDMGRTVLNVIGDMCGALYLQTVDGGKLSTAEVAAD